MTARIAIVATCALLATSGAAQAASPTEDAYGGLPAGQVTNEGNGSNPDGPTPNTVTARTASADSTGKLPFTGFEMGFVALAGAGLLGAGVMVRRTARPRDLQV